MNYTRAWEDNGHDLEKMTCKITVMICKIDQLDLYQLSIQ